MKEEILIKLGDAVSDYDAEAAEKLSKHVLAEGVDPLKALETFTETIRVVGDKFEKSEIFLPELIAAAEAMTAATSVLEEEIRRQGKEKKSSGKIVIGTVLGDIHDIGKNIVATLMRASGYHVYDCGVNVEAQKFIEALRSEKSDVLALSALLTTTAREQDKVIQTLEKEGERESLNIIVGGGGITEEFAQSIGADGYAATAAGAVKLVHTLLKGRGE